MDKVKIITDSTCDLDEEIVLENDIEVVPLNICFGNEFFLDKIQINLKQMFERIKSSSFFPKTTQVNPQKFINIYKEYLNNGFKIISMHISSNMSGTYNSALIAKDYFNNDDDIQVVDTHNVTGGLGLLVLEAAKNIKNGFGFADTLDKVKNLIPRVKNIIILDTFENLIRGGRLNKAIGLIGNILDIKPIIEMEDGTPVLKDKARGIKKAKKYLMDFIDNIHPDKILDLMLMDSLNSELKNFAKEKLIERGIKFIESTIGCTVGAHAGERACGVFYIEN